MIFAPRQPLLYPHDAGRSRHNGALPLVDERKKFFSFLDGHHSLAIAFENLGRAMVPRGPDYGRVYAQAGFEPDEKGRWPQLPQNGYSPVIGTRNAREARMRMLERIRTAHGQGMMGIEAIDAFGNLEQLDELVKARRESRVRLKAQLTYNHRNQFATGCRVWNGEIGGTGTYDIESGLSKDGRKAVRKLLKTGIVIDVSHLNKGSTLEACRIATERKNPKPVIASHSNTLFVFCGESKFSATQNVDRFAIRCLDDEGILAILKTGGYVGLTPIPLFLDVESSMLSGEERLAFTEELQKTPDKYRDHHDKSLALLIRHVEHVRKIARANGLDPRKSVALASDAEYVSGTKIIDTPLGYSEQEYARIFAELAEALQSAEFMQGIDKSLKPWKDADVEALMHGNAERVFYPGKK